MLFSAFWTALLEDKAFKPFKPASLSALSDQAPQSAPISRSSRSTVLRCVPGNPPLVVYQTVGALRSGPLQRVARALALGAVREPAGRGA